ncbi:hypothetical protein AWC38_SpisGene21154 [Stylophora pistillata]|uniref:Uncharacterized protein n=1 Tax=Stylophora pistillata TaxID=50429 RepID=A0A2B4RDW4_STYPI|nr:hypothetical protein AWC38_SpisGene21154 [Stylophora pistillata]
MEFSEHDGGIMDSGEHDDGNFENVSTVAGDNVLSESLHAVNGDSYVSRATHQTRGTTVPTTNALIYKEPGHLGANCDYYWVFPTVHGVPTDESEIVNIEDEPQHSPSTDVNIEDDQQDSSSIDENLPLSFFPPPAQTAEQPIHSSPEQPVSDLTAKPLPDEQPNEHNHPDLPSEQSDLPFEQTGQSSESTPTDSSIVTFQGLIATIKSAIKPPSRRTPAKLLDEFSLACSRKSTAPTLVSGKPRSSIPVPTASHTPILVTPNNPEEEMETSHELKRKSSSSELSTSTSEWKKGRNRSRKPK